MTFCDEHDGGCGASLTATDYECGYCTQCKRPLTTKETRTMTTVTFGEVAIRGQKSVKCAGGCGRRLKRAKKFWQTLSPFNKNSAGEIKNREQIYEELRGERRVWLNEPETCSHCN